jgi:hypothetical protein
VIHPWYLGWSTVLEPLAPSAPWLLWTATACLNYGWLAAPPDRATYHPTSWLKLFEYGLPALLALALWWVRRSAPAPRSEEGHA